jgi:lipid A ethanolaminephosphotransferase
LDISLPSNIKFSQLKLSTILLLLVGCLFILISGNLSFFHQVNGIYPWAQNQGFILSLALVVYAVIFLLALTLELILPVRLVLSLLLLIAAATAYFADSYGTVIDVDMIRNTLQTNVAEAGDLITFNLLVHLIFWALVPIVLMYFIPLQKLALSTRIKHRLLASVSAVALIVICLFSFSGHYASFFREHKPLRYFINPVFPVYSAGQYLARNLKSDLNQKYVHTADYAKLPDIDLHRELVIVVVGETARTDHFSLNGYSRQTNPLLEKTANIISYSDITSCGTSTAISVPCMFAIAGRDDFNVDQAEQTENVLDLVVEAGPRVLWRDNNSDSKGVAGRFPYQNFKTAENNPICDEECRDVGMLVDLQQYIDQQSGDIMIVLHQMGSHGPAFYKRYPAEFELFTPACHSAELSECSDKEIINAYDNTVLYTDYFLAEVIALLKRNTPKYETSMLYVSDHGESLGESGLYLHGLPFMFAPQEQTKVAVILWVGESSDIDFAASEKLRDVPNSHDAIARAILTVMEVDSNAILPDSPPLFLLKKNNQ